MLLDFVILSIFETGARPRAVCIKMALPCAGGSDKTMHSDVCHELFMLYAELLGGISDREVFPAVDENVCQCSAVLVAVVAA